MVVGVVGVVYRCSDVGEQKDGVHSWNWKYDVTKDLLYFLKRSELEGELVLCLCIDGMRVESSPYQSLVAE